MWVWVQVHRVTAEREALREERLSLAFFSSPNKNALIETIGPASTLDCDNDYLHTSRANTLDNSIVTS
jgi:isopenicillin N synthase-like dioxygenase